MSEVRYTLSASHGSGSPVLEWPRLTREGLLRALGLMLAEGNDDPLAADKPDLHLWIASEDVDEKPLPTADACRCWNEGQYGRVHREDCPIHQDESDRVGIEPLADELAPVAPRAVVEEVPICRCTNEALERGQFCEADNCPGRS